MFILASRVSAKAQKAFIQPCPPVLKRSCLAVFLVLCVCLFWEQG